MYGCLSRWERRAFYIVLQSAALGKMPAKTDRMTWAQVSKEMGIS
jgi:hypothetical protein